MSFEVVLTQRAQDQLKRAAQWYQHEIPQLADSWFNGFVEAIASLELNPERCSLARENDAFPFELRQLLYGLGKRKTHRALFVIRPNCIVVQAIRHLAQQDISADDI